MKFYLFPRSKYLQNKWWHRLARVIIAIVTIFSFAILLLGSYAYKKALKSWRNFEPYNLESKMENGIIPPEIIKESEIKGHEEEKLRENLTFSLLMLLISLSGLVGPTILYRLVLYVVLGDKWKDKD